MPGELRIGIIGFDTSHAPAFAKLLNDATDPHHVPGAQVVAGFPSFSSDLEASRSRVGAFTRQLRDEFGVQVVDSVGELVEQVDAVLLESVDGRRHLTEARPVIQARKPLFIDKPLAASYRDAAAIVHLARSHQCPIFSSSPMRFDANITALKNDAELGEILACDAFSPAHLDSTNPGLFWYGIHGVEIVYALMGPGCQSVHCFHTDDCDIVVGAWPGGRSATMRGLRRGALDYGVSVFGAGKVAQTTYSREVPIYVQLLKEVVPFLQGAPAPVAIEETLEIIAFIQAAILSQSENRSVSLSLSEIE